MRAIAGAAAALALVAYPLAAYGLLEAWGPSALAGWTFVASVGLLVRGTVAARVARPPAGRPDLRPPGPGLEVLVGGAGVLLAGLALAIGEIAPALLLPVATNAALAVGFGSTLVGDQRPMIERFARLQHPDLSVVEAAWCRTWTRIWVGFFVANAVAGTALAWWAPLEWWVVHTGGLAYLMVGLLVAVEYVLRKLRFDRPGRTWPDRQLDRARALLRARSAP